MMGRNWGEGMHKEWTVDSAGRRASALGHEMRRGRRRRLGLRSPATHREWERK